MKTKQSGFHLIGLVIAVGVVGLLGLAGYKVWQNNSSKSDSQASQALPIAPEIKTTSDLTKASDTVKQLDDSADSSDLTSLEKELDSL